MEGPPSICSFSDKSLTTIVQEVAVAYSDMKSIVSVKNDTALLTPFNKRKSDFAFLCRMAQKKAQWLLYNGEELVFGNTKPKNFTLEYGRTLHSFNIEMRAKSMGFEYLGYDPSNGKTQKANSGEVNYQTKVILR